ncbi:MAG: carboxypeptidase regulatory-like domain-containing protein [Gemmatimonadota bacterium]|nr:MAG: carboxypeptidase regulatory-like domain-containing protein [Gemmatimonadota bacterium]
MTSNRIVSRALTLALAMGFLGTGASAQSIVAGSIDGIVTDGAGIPLRGVHLILTQTASGITRESETDRLGRFEFLLLQPGEYTLFAERLGDQPVAVSGIPVGQGRRISVPISLEPVELPVMEVRSERYGSAALKIGGSDGGRLFTDLELAEMPHWTREAAELGRFATNSDATLATEGLPTQLVGFRVDGVPFQGVVHGGLPWQPLRTAPFTVASFEQLQMLTNGVDVEYSGSAGASLSGFSRRGTRDLEFGVFGDWTGSAMSGSKYIDSGSLSYNSVRGGITASGPIVRDTSHFIVGFEARKLETALPSAWVPTDADSAFVAAAANSFGVDLSGYVQPRLTSTDLYTGFGRLDWQFGEQTALAVRADFGSLKSMNPVLGWQRLPTEGVELKGTDIFGTASLATRISRVFGLELRVGFGSSRREYSLGELPATSLASWPIVLGTDPVLPGDFSQFAFWANETLHFRLSNHSFKLGGTARIASTDHSHTPYRFGGFYFGGLDDFANRDARYDQSVSSFPNAEFITSEFGGYLQDTWTPLTGVAITAGFRLDWELLPSGEVRLNQRWFDLTGVSNAAVPSSIFKVSPRMGLVVERGSYIVRADWTVHHGTVEPTTFAEVVTTGGSIDRRRGLGQLSGWPNPPDSATAPIAGPVLSLLDPDYRPPRTMRTSVGLTARIGTNATFDISGAYRRTDNLTRRNDLNLITAASSEDQYGRPMYGTTVQAGAILGAEAGTNRRFNQFDLVSSLDSDGFSDYWGITARLERRLGSGLRLFASYTYSQTKDNWLSGLGGQPESQLTPFPDSLGGSDWARGRSDLDVPHRVAIGSELDFGAIKLSAFYRGQSGVPFTPGFRRGQDMNGDGSAHNDPAFVDDQIAGVTDLLSQWDCLRDQVGRFAERNACRGPWIGTLDLRFTLRTIRLGSYPMEVVVDALNLLDADIAEPDRAIYLLDPSTPVSRNPATGVVTVPLIVNPDFGKPMKRYSSGRALRLGVHVNYD